MAAAAEGVRSSERGLKVQGQEEEMGRQEPALPDLVVVPRAPGPLIIPEPAGRRDEVDVGLDELFGPPTDQKPGPLDATLVVGGIATAVFAEAVYHGGALLVVAIGATLLGLVLPTRSLYRGIVRGRARRRLDRVLTDGDPLNLVDPTTRRLATVYSRLEAQGHGDDDPMGQEAAESALQAMQEVAVLLRGRRPRGAAEHEYVRTRQEALEGLEESIAAGTSTVEALTRFEESTGMSSIDRIKVLRSTLEASQRHE